MTKRSLQVLQGLILVMYLAFPYLSAANASPSDVEVSRFRNLQFIELEPNDADFLRTKNLQYVELVCGNADVVRLRNLQCLQVEPNNADVIRLRNLQFFELEPLFYEYKINITKLEITDQEGNPATSFIKGDIVQVFFTIENFGAPQNLPLIDGLISLEILDPAGNVVYLAYTFSDIQRGESKDFIFGYKIPNDAPTGTYTVKVMVFTDWPSEGGLGLDVESKVFVVS